MPDPTHPHSKQSDYHAYLLRVWREEGDGWRVSLQPTGSPERFGFADLHTALAFVEQHLRNSSQEMRHEQ
ncbi:MAG: hypothetical protein OT477_22455 [Chloroflexi bacterium]|nr:hypothetical protein [Chloroflexota bacterium]